MSIPGYVVPGQIICPLVDKKDGFLRKYIPGNGVVLSQIRNDNAASVDALTAVVVGKVGIKDVTQTPEGRALVGSSKDSKKLAFLVEIENKFQPVVKGEEKKATSEYDAKKVTRVSNAPLPAVGDVVLARVTKLSLKQANVQILAVESVGVVSADSGVGINGSVNGVIPPTSVTSSSASTLDTISYHNSTSTSSSASDVGEGFGGIIRQQDVRIGERDKVKIIECFRPGDIVRAIVVCFECLIVM